jgi:hypothetical protein
MIRQQLTELGALQSICSSIMAPSSPVSSRIPLMLAVAALARDSPSNVSFFIQKGFSLSKYTS